ncbi:protein neprosin-like [Lycium ferocissimum]|uniref:protein neprosin-like n=1 Tax=Lycium ferocissimum TaxID=112874 RepID=UPI0028169187|nr:protein neprosin-like [Lycium ferocissimum]
MCLLVSYDGVKGEMKLSKLEELALEKQLQLLNKPSVKTIKTEWGDTYDCVDFYKQPAFDHPSLKNHNFHPGMKPTLTKIKQIPTNSTIDVSPNTWSGNERCPAGTVPIKRVTKNDLIRQRRMPPPEDFTSESQLEDTNNNLEATGVYTVDPTLYGGTETRLFIHFQAGKTHCFNTLCSGFVLVNSDIAIDGVFHSVTRKGKTIWEIALYIDRVQFMYLFV